MVHITFQLLLAPCLASLVVATVVPREDFVAIPIFKPNVTSRDPRELFAKENDRIRSFRRDGAPAISQFIQYVVSTQVGGQTFDLVVDTGGGNTWVGAKKGFFAGSPAVSTGNSVSVKYEHGYFNGVEWLDSVTLGGLTVAKQSIGVPSNFYGLYGADGMLGFGPVELTIGTVANTDTVPTFLNNLHNQGSIKTEVLGIYFLPGGGSQGQSGMLTLGGVDRSKYQGVMHYTPRVGNHFWTITVSSIKFGSTSLVGSIRAIVDTGTTFIVFPDSAFAQLLKETGGVAEQTRGLAVFSKKPTSNISFTIAGANLQLTPSQYLIPAANYGAFGLPSDKSYAWITRGGDRGILGLKFLEQFYSAFDATPGKNCVGFAPVA